MYLAGLYANGTGVSKDFGEAVKYYKMAAYQGHRESMTILGSKARIFTYFFLFLFVLYVIFMIFMIFTIFIFIKSVGSILICRRLLR